MINKVGLWLDHKKAVIVEIKGDESETIEIFSKVEKLPSRQKGAPTNEPYEAHLVQGDDILEREFKEHIHRYYDDIISHLKDFEAIYIFGPSEAKIELEKRIQEKHKNLKQAIKQVEAADKMTNPQIAAKVRDFFRFGKN